MTWTVPTCNTTKRSCTPWLFNQASSEGTHPLPLSLISSPALLESRGVQSGYQFGLGLFFRFSVFQLVKYNYHSKSIFTSVRFGLYTIGFWFIRFYTKKI